MVVIQMSIPNRATSDLPSRRASDSAPSAGSIAELAADRLPDALPYSARVSG